MASIRPNVGGKVIDSVKLQELGRSIRQSFDQIPSRGNIEIDIRVNRAVSEACD